MLYIDFMPIYPVIDYNAIAMDSFHAIPPGGNHGTVKRHRPSWNHEQGCAKLMMRSLCGAHQSPESSWRFGSDLVRWASLWAVNYKDRGKPFFCVNRGWRLRSPDRKKGSLWVSIAATRPRRRASSALASFFPSFAWRLCPEDVQCAGSLRLKQGHESVSVSFNLFLSCYLSAWMSVPSRRLEKTPLPFHLHRRLKFWSEQLLVQRREMKSHNVWVYCSERHELFCMSSTQGS